MFKVIADKLEGNMGKTAFIFPGQGAQYFGMARDFYEQCPDSKKVFDRASELLDMDMPALCFDENDRLNITEYTQIALLTAELAMLEMVGAKGIQADITAGLSLGEYAALAASGRMSGEDALLVVRSRGKFMQEAVPSGGAMSAVLGLDAEAAVRVCAAISGVVELANYNCPGQIVISGDAAAVSAAGEQLKAAGAKRVAPLKVSGPFHSSLLNKAGEQLEQVLEPIQLKVSEIPYVANTTAEIVTDNAQIKPLLVKQVYSSVLWEQSVRRMLAEGIDTFIEIGPGKTLAGFMRRIDKSVAVINIETVADLEKL